MDRKSVISLIIFTIVWLKTIKFYRIWSVFGQLIQTSTKFCSCKIVLKHSSFKEKLLKIEVKKMNLGLLQWSGGDANHFFFYLALTRIIQARTQEDALGACAPPPPPTWKNVPLRNVQKRRESSVQICRQKRICTFRSDKTKLKRKRH